MKKRILSLALTAAMLITSISAAGIASAATVSPNDTSSAQVLASPFIKEVYEAEDALLTGTAKKDTLDDFRGTGYVDGLPKNAAISFTVTADVAGSYGVRLRYTNGTGSSKNVSVYVNGTKIRSSALAATINNTTWDVQLENLNLNVGVNTIEYKNDADNNCEAVRFDRIALSRIYEAEDTTVAERLGGIDLDGDAHKHPDFSGTGALGGFSAYQGVKYTITVPEAGEYSLVTRYGAGQDNSASRILVYYVNDKSTRCDLATMRNWEIWTDFQLTVTLKKGVNTIMIRNDDLRNDKGEPLDNGQINMDYITVKPVQWEYAGNITNVTGNNTKELTFELDNSKVRLSSVGKNAVKVWLEPTGLFREKYESFSVVDDAIDPQNLKTVDKTTYYEIATGDMVMRINKAPFKITYLDKSGNIICENKNESMGWTADGELKVNNILPPDEQFWGLGEKLNDFNRRGQKLIMWSVDAYGAAPDSSVSSWDEGRWYGTNPYFISSKGYSILFDNSSRTVFDFGKDDPNTYSFASLNPNPGGELKYYFVYGPEMKQISKTFTDIVGKSFFAPEWAYGNIQCHYGYTQDDIVKVAQTYRDKNIPVDMIMADIEWYQYLCTPTAWNTRDFSKPDEMLATLSDLNIRMGLIDDPNITNRDNNADFAKGNALGYFVKSQLGTTKLVNWPWGAASGLTDFFNPDARSWWGELHNKILGQGIAGFWLDMNEPAKYNTDWLFYNEDGKAYGTLSEVKNAYAIKHHEAMYDKLTEDGERPFMLTRSTYTGSQRYVSPWTGDIQGSYQSMHEQINMGTSLSLSGYNYWGFDIGGFFGDLTTDMYKRWVELACFTPVHRFHYMTGGPKEPWTHESEDVSRNYINLRYQLKPYMYSLTADNILGIGIEEGYGDGGTGVPYVRPMMMEYQDDPNTWSMDTQFMAGPSFLVAPVVELATEKKIYLPEGNWYDYNNSPLMYTGNQTITYEAPSDVLPVLVKEGSIIPMQPVMQYMGEKTIDLITLDVYPTVENGDFNFVLYEDDGETEEYIESDTYTTTDFDCNVSINGNKKTYTFDIGQRTGTYTDIASRSYLMQFHAGALNDLSVKLGNTALTAKASLEALNTSESGYYTDKLHDICYVKIADTANAMKVVISGEKSDNNSKEAEDGTLAGNAKTANSAAGYSGTGYVTDIKGTTDSVTFDLISEKSGMYEVALRYHSDTSTKLTLSSDGEDITVSLAGRSSGEWEDTVALINLTKGINQITVSGTGNSGSALVDSINISEESYKFPVYNDNTIEAENGTLLGTAKVSSEGSEYTGTGYVDTITATGNGVTFKNISVDKAGRYNVKLRYLNTYEQARTLSIYANDNETGAVKLTLPRLRIEMDKPTWNEVSYTLDLIEGVNTVTVIKSAADSGGVLLDSLYIPLEPLDIAEVPAIVNGGFESGGTNGWTLTSNKSGGSGVDTYDAALDSRKFYIFDGEKDSVKTLAQTVTGLENGNYIVCAWIKAYNSEANEAYVQLSDSGTSQPVKMDIPHNGKWTKYSIPVEVLNGKLTISFYFDSPKSSSLQLDGISLFRVISAQSTIRNTLESAINSAKGLDHAAYSADSFNAYQTAMQLAEKWYADQTTTSEQLVAVMKLLNSAKTNLKAYESPALSSTLCTVDNTARIVKKVSSITSLADFKASFNKPVTIYDKSGKEVTDRNISGSMTLKINSTGEIFYDIWVTGDINDDGELDSTDIAQICNVLTGRVKTPAYVERSYVNPDNQLDIADITAVRNIIMGK